MMTVLMLLLTVMTTKHLRRTAMSMTAGWRVRHCLPSCPPNRLFLHRPCPLSHIRHESTAPVGAAPFSNRIPSRTDSANCGPWRCRCPFSSYPKVSFVLSRCSLVYLRTSEGTGDQASQVSRQVSRRATVRLFAVLNSLRQAAVAAAAG